MLRINQPSADSKQPVGDVSLFHTFPYITDPANAAASSQSALVVIFSEPDGHTFVFFVPATKVNSRGVDAVGDAVDDAVGDGVGGDGPSVGDGGLVRASPPGE